MFARNATKAYNLTPLLIKRNIACSSTCLEKNNTKGKESKLKEYALTSYMNYMKKYEKKLEKRFPSAMHIYRIFSDGIKSFYKDLKTFFRIRYILLGNEEELSVLTRSEIEVHNQMPKDMLKVAPVILLSALPFANYIVFPVAYMYPQRFLSSHFWSAEQKELFHSSMLKQRLQYNSTTLKFLIQYSDVIKEKNIKYVWKEVLNLLSNGTHPSVEQLIACKPLFVSGPYCLDNLHFGHTNSLLHIHGLTSNFSRKQNLIQRAFILKEMDNAVIREGGVQPLETSVLKNLCLIRGLYWTNISNDEMISWLQKWLLLSKHVERESFSLLLHASLLIGANHPNNIKLLEQLKIT